MKKISTLLVFFLIAVIPSKAQYTGLFGVPSGTFLEDVVWADTNTVMVTGSNLYRTSIDGARNWYGLSSAGMFVKSAHFSSIHFGIAVGNAGMYRTNKECGYFWGWSNNQSVGVSKDLLDVFFIDDNKGIVCGNDGTLRRTVNQGTNWTAIAPGTTNHIRGVYSTNDSISFACTDGGIVLKIVNNTVTQSTVLNAAINFNKICFPDSVTGFVVGSAGTIYKTTDGGTTWNLQTSGTTESLLAVEFTNLNHGVATGTNGKIIVTDNGGSTWAPATLVAFTDVRSVAFRNDLEAYAVGSNFTLYTKDGGHSWTRADGTTQSVHFPTPERGYTVGFYGVAYKTNDKGNTWKPMNLNTIQYLNDVQFINKDTGYVVGGADVYRTLDGGETWSRITNPATSSLYSVHFTDYLHGVAAGYRKNIIYTNNGGASWTLSQNSSSTVYYLDIKFTSPSVGYMCSTVGEILKTTNGGASWTPQVSGTSSQLANLFFINSNEGWAVGMNGTIRHTTNGGTTWTGQTSGVTTYLNGVHFFDANRGVITGQTGTYLYTRDGGATWINRTSGSVDYTDIFFTDSLHGYAANSSSVSGIGPFSNGIYTGYAYCPGDNISFNAFDPYHTPNTNTNVLYELTAENDPDFSNAITLTSTGVDSVGLISGILPATLPAGIYKTRIVSPGNPQLTSFEKYITVTSKPVVSFTVQGTNLVATSDQAVTFTWYYRASSSFTYAGSGAVLPIPGPGDFYVIANSSCCTSQTDWVSVIQCNGNYMFASVTNAASICEGQSYSVGPFTHTLAGTYRDTLTSVAGCDSIVITTLGVTPRDSIFQALTLCNGQSISIGSFTHNSNGIYSDTLVNLHGCDSIVVTDLTILQADSISQSFTLCSGETVTVGTFVHAASGNYVDTLINHYGCDSMVYTQLTVLPPDTVSRFYSFCHGGSVTVGANTYTTSGMYTDTLTGSGGCDSIIYTHLIVFPFDTASYYTSICQGDSLLVGSSVYTADGNYTNTFTNANGCDSIIYTHLTVTPLPVLFLGNDTIICEGHNLVLDAGTASGYLWSTGELTQTISVSDTGTYAVTINNAQGCTATDTIAVMLDPCLSLTNITVGNFIQVYPNPSPGRVFIQLRQPAASLILYDALGQEVFREPSAKDLITLHGLAQGIYFLHATFEGNTFIVKLIITE